MIVPNQGDVPFEGEVNYVEVQQDPDQSSEDFPTNLLVKASPGVSFTYMLSFQLLNLSLIIYVHLHSGVEMKP